MRIQNNIAAYNTHRNYTLTNNSVASSAEKLSSGYRINRAGDDAAGLAISEKMRAQIRGLEMASKNSSDAVSLVNTAEGALQKTHDILQRMRELATQSSSDTNEQVIDRGALDQEFQQLKEEIDDIARVTRFNDQNLIDGTFQKNFYSVGITDSKFQAGVSASVVRVGTKPIQVGEEIKIKTQYIVGQDEVAATRAQVTHDISITTGATGTTIQNATFTAVNGAVHNGKTFTISASGNGTDPNNLKVTIDDGTTTYEGTVEFNGNMADGGFMDIHFEGVGTLSLLVKSSGTTEGADISKIAEGLNTKELKFSNKSQQVSTGLTELMTRTSATTGMANTYANGSMSLLTKSTAVLAVSATNGAVTGGAGGTVSLVQADGVTTAPAAVTYKYLDIDGGADARKAGILSIEIAGVGKIELSKDASLNATTGALDDTVAATDINKLIDDAGFGLGSVRTEGAVGTGDVLATFGAYGGGSDLIEATDPSIALSLNGEVVSLSQNDTSATFDYSGVSIKFNALDITGLAAADQNDAGAVKLFTSSGDAQYIKIAVTKADGKALTIQTGANQGDELKINIDAMDLEMLGLTSTSINSQKNASKAITDVNNALNQVSTQRAALGALSNRLGFKIENLDISAENLTSAESRIRDVDMAKEMTAFSKKNILSQAATAMLAQANSLPQNVLQLLR